MWLSGTSKTYDKSKQKKVHEIVLDPLANILLYYISISQDACIFAIGDIVHLFLILPNSPEISPLKEKGE